MLGPKLFQVSKDLHLDKKGKNGECIQNGHVGKVVNKCSEVRLGTTALVPLLLERVTIGTNDIHWRQELRHLEASSKHDDIILVHSSGRADNTVLGDSLQAFGDEFDVLAVQGIEITRISDLPLAPELEVRCQDIMVLLGSLALDVLSGNLLLL